MTSYNVSDWVFIPDEDNVILPARVLTPFKAGASGKVAVQTIAPHQLGMKRLPGVKSPPLEFVEEERTLSPKETKSLERMDPNSLQPIDDLVNIRSLTENSILHNLHLRFAEDKIYTSVGAILVSVNPFKEIPLYTAEVLDKYKTNGYRNMPPHVFGVADLAYSSLTANGTDQSCIVSGESGAGKTEATKIFLQFIANVSSQAERQNKDTLDDKKAEKVSLQEQILKANPLMEAFGNAKTVRNDNSSRFGKWIEISFDNKKGTIVGGRIVQYLLEKSRIVAQAKNERNYHIFYNLCAGGLMDSEVKKKFGIGSPENYNYLKHPDEDYVSSVPGLNDERAWEDVLNAMNALEINFQEQDDLLRTLAGILHLGNITFREKANSHAGDCEIVNPQMLEVAASQFGTTAAELEESLLKQKINTVRETTTKHLSRAGAMDARDVLAKTLYSNMFDWLIERINRSFLLNTNTKEVKKENKSIIGVLDIFGFEVFKNNSLEQLCINYCNEKLQFHFNDHIFKLEEALYKSEGIDVSKIEFQDNQKTIDLFEHKRSGIFAQLDEVMLLPHGTEEKFLKNVENVHKGHSNFKPRGVKTNYERSSFAVIHYAGQVRYSIIGFLEKNSDKFSPDLVSLLMKSKIPFVKSLIPQSALPKDGNGKGTRVNNRKKGASLCTKFKNQLNDLMKILTRTEPQFIRCIKPNHEKVGNIFSSRMILEQLRYAGLLEVCRIRQLGYPIRREFRRFLFQYGCLIENFTYSREEVSAKKIKDLCTLLLEKELLQSGEFAIGKTKVFMRGSQVDILEASREQALKVQALTVQRVVRGWIERKKYKEYLKIIESLHIAVQKRDVAAINTAIENYAELPFGGRHRKELATTKKLLQEMEENDRVIELLQAAVNEADINTLKTALQASSSMDIVDNYKEAEIEKCVSEAKQLLQQLEAEEKAKEELKKAMEQHSLEQLTEALRVMNELGLTQIKEYQQGEVMRAKLEEEQRILRNIETAVKEEHLERLQDALSSAADYPKLTNSEIVIAGQKKRDELVARIHEEEERKKEEAKAAAEEAKKQKAAEALEEVRLQLAQAIEEKNLTKAFELRLRALELGMSKDVLDTMLAEVDTVKKMEEQVSALKAAMKGLNTLMLNKNGISRQDMNYLSDVIDNARENGLTEDNAVLSSAVELEESAHKQLEVQKNLEIAIEKKDYSALKTAIDDADALNLSIDLLLTARDILREATFLKKPEFKPSVNRLSIRYGHTGNDGENSIPDGDTIEPPDINDEDMDRRREQMHEEGALPKYRFQKYYNIRSPGDYVRGLIFNKRRTMENQLRYQTNAIPKSILNLRKDFSKQAVSINKSILGYCGETSMQFPATLAQDILEKGLTTPDLVDEIYIQFCKHATENNKPESLQRVWQLICMAVGTFPPSTEFEFYLINFLIANKDGDNMVRFYARYSLRRLDAMLIRGASGFLPNLDEILAYKQRPPVLSTLELVDGSYITENFPVPPEFNVKKVVDMCLHFLNINDRVEQFGIYVQEDIDNEDPGLGVPQSGYSAMRYGIVDDMAPPPPPLPDAAEDTGNEIVETPRPLRDSDFLGDVVLSSWRKGTKYILVFKKKLFVPDDDERSDNEMYRRTIYLQAADEIVRGSVMVRNEKDLLLLTAIALMLDLPEGMNFPGSEKQLLDQNLMAFIPFNWQNKKTALNWARAVVKMRGKVIRKSKEELQQTYVDIVRKLPLWGFNFFFVRERAEAKDLICGVNYDGLSFFTPSRKLKYQYSFDDIERWGGSSKQFWILVFQRDVKTKAKVSLHTKQARDISNLILDYTKLKKALKQNKP